MIVAGIGFRSAASVADLAEALALTGQTPDALASVAIKASQPQLQTLARQMNLPLLALDQDDIAGEPTLTCSPRIKARFATGSLAEASACVGARQSHRSAETTPNEATVRLLGPRVITPNGMATAAIAERTLK